MSEIDFALSGPSGEHFAGWDYDRECEDEVSFLPKEHAFIEQKNLAGRPLSQRITYLSNEKFTISEVDDIIQVKSFSKTYRDERVNFWKDKRFTTGISSTVLLAGGMATIPFMTAAVGVACAAASCFGFYRTYQAHHQVSQWSRDLPAMVANQRKEAFDQGLLSIYKRDQEGAKGAPYLFSKIMSSNELGGLYMEYLEKLNQKLEQSHSTKDKIGQLQSLAEYSPLSHKITGYARLYPYHLSMLNPYIGEHTQFEKVYKQVESLKKEKIAQIEKQASDHISSIVQGRTAAQLIAYTTYNHYQKNAECRLNEKLDSLQCDTLRKAALADFEKDLAQAKELRDSSLRLIALPFDMRIAAVKQERDNATQEIVRNSEAHLLPIFRHVADLHKEAFLVLSGAQASRNISNPGVFYPQFPDLPAMGPTPSAPPMEEILRQQQGKFNPAVYQEMLRIYKEEALTS